MNRLNILFENLVSSFRDKPTQKRQTQSSFVSSSQLVSHNLVVAKFWNKTQKSANDWRPDKCYFSAKSHSKIASHNFVLVIQAKNQQNSVIFFDLFLNALHHRLPIRLNCFFGIR